MGAQQSSRRITVVSDEASGVIKISDSVVNRLKEEIEGANNNQQKPEPPTPVPYEPSPPPPRMVEEHPTPEAPVHETPTEVIPEVVMTQPPKPDVTIPPVRQEPQPVESGFYQESRIQRPIIHYVEEPSLSSLKIRAEKEQELNDLDSHWRKRMHDVEQEKTTISNLQAASIAMSVKELEDILDYKPVAPVCTSQRNLVTKCLKENKGKPLNCGDYVKEFSNCANLARLSYLDRSG